MKTLISHLARRGDLSKNGELYCTEALAYLLQDDTLSRTWLADLSTQVGLDLSDAVIWQAEPTQQDGGRPDLEGTNADGSCLIKVEAKLGHTLSADQLMCYRDDLNVRTKRGALVVLVPAYRLRDAREALRDCLGSAADYPEPWRLAERPRVGALAVTWRQVWTTLERAATTERLRRDVEVAKTLYLGLTGLDMTPLAGLESLIHWRTREADVHAWVDWVTRELSEGPVMPIGEVAALGRPDVSGEPSMYRRRYLSRRLNKMRVDFCIGSRDPFEVYVTPIWLRFDRETAGYAIVLHRLEHSPLARRIVLDDGHIWLPLMVPIEVDGPAIVTALAAQALQVMHVVFGGPGGPVGGPFIGVSGRQWAEPNHRVPWHPATKPAALKSRAAATKLHRLHEALVRHSPPDEPNWKDVGHIHAVAETAHIVCRHECRGEDVPYPYEGQPAVGTRPESAYHQHHAAAIDSLDFLLTELASAVSHDIDMPSKDTEYMLNRLYDDACEPSDIYFREGEWDHA